MDDRTNIVGTAADTAAGGLSHATGRSFAFYTHPDVDCLSDVCPSYDDCHTNTDIYAYFFPYSDDVANCDADSGAGWLSKTSGGLHACGWQ